MKQGMTLTRVELMLDGAFAHGQAYVALSRVTSLAGLWMRTNLRVEQVTAHPEVLRYYNALSESRRNPTNWQDTTASTAASASGTSHGTFPSGFMGGAAVHSFPNWRPGTSPPAESTPIDGSFGNSDAWRNDSTAKPSSG